MAVRAAVNSFRRLLETERGGPLVALGYLPAGHTTPAGIAIEAAGRDGPVGFQVDAALDVRAVALASFRRLPPMLQPRVAREAAWSLARFEGGVLPLLRLDRLLTAGERRLLHEQSAALTATAPRSG